ncbi:MAG: hypothetical protein ACPL7K_04460, partial [Armatimonadota bacterium]
MDQLTSRFSRRLKLPAATLMLMCCDALAVAAALVISLVLRYDQAPVLQTLTRKIGPREISVLLS